MSKLLDLINNNYLNYIWNRCLDNHISIIGSQEDTLKIIHLF